MVVVISMILVLLSIALPMYNQSIVRAKEAKLHQNLATLNDVIEKFSLDKGHAPQSLDDLVQAGYIKFIPEDITGTHRHLADGCRKIRKMRGIRTRPELQECTADRMRPRATGVPIRVGATRSPDRNRRGTRLRDKRRESKNDRTRPRDSR